MIQDKYPGLRVTEVVKMIAKQWQKLTKAQKQKYKEAAKRGKCRLSVDTDLDKERFAQELVELSKGQDDTLLYKMPKKPLTAYMFFVREVSDQLLTFADQKQGGNTDA